MITQLYIKNMVCPRCIETVKNIFDELSIEISSIQLGEVNSPKEISQVLRLELEKQLSLKGFELLQDNNSKLINKIKAILIEYIHYNENSLNINFSTLLSKKLNHEYTSLSRLFSSVEGITIEKFILKQKIERVKELLFYNELTLSEISYQMNYSSVAHLSQQFKKETGMTPSIFKKQKKPGHRFLDSL